MEEKERYEIHVYDDCCVDLYDNGVLDKSITDTWELEKLLNQQSKRIKELEAKLKESKKQCQECKHLNKKIELNIKNKLMNETQQLEQQLNDLPKKIMEYISKELKSLYKNYPIIYSEDKDIVKSCYDKDSVNKILDTILKKFGGEDE